ncbi:uncharacterized protein G2W53_034803 [Senna tora]|uniref:Uncharacterized protein n=1 Tax=Senna tora TaxID=362788 RepID=A0A834T4V5_9FABA|nr:uncharacterized protein G2W53_034803 [Senna tora]
MGPRRRFSPRSEQARDCQVFRLGNI